MLEEEERGKRLEEGAFMFHSKSKEQNCGLEQYLLQAFSNTKMMECLGFSDVPRIVFWLNSIRLI